MQEEEDPTDIKERREGIGEKVLAVRGGGKVHNISPWTKGELVPVPPTRCRAARPMSHECKAKIC